MNASPQKNKNTTDAFQIITDKRQALETLINIAKGVKQQHSALSELSYAARPSQDFPPTVIRYFSAIEDRLKSTSTPGVIKKLELIEKVTEKALTQIINLAEIDVNQLRANEIQELDAEAFNQFIDDFKRRTRTSLGLRCLLKKRGVAIAPFHLPIPQETIREQIEHLKTKENFCIDQVRSEIEQIINDSDHLLTQPGLDENIVNELKQVVSGMRVNLVHLDKGGSITEIPNVFEVITLETNNDEYNTDFTDESNNQSTNNESIHIATQKNNEPLNSNQDSITVEAPIALSFWGKLKLWLNSPWNKNWKSIQDKKNKDSG